jgi:hypothetical protein
MTEKKFFLARESIRELVPQFGACLATDRITVEGRKVGYMYRDNPTFPQDTGWRFFAGDEDQKYIDDPGNSSVYAVNKIANYDPDIIPYLFTPAPCAFEKITGTTNYKRVPL